MRTDARTVESFPPDAPIAIRSPGEKRDVVVMVWWISSSKMVIKQPLQSFWWFFGRIIKARAVLHMAQREGAILKSNNANRSAATISPSILESSKIFQVGGEQTERTHVFTDPNAKRERQDFWCPLNPTFRENLEIFFSVNFNDDNHRKSLHHRRSESDKMVSF